MAHDRLIINSPYEEPKHYWRYARETRTFDLAEGRRPAGYVVASGVAGYRVPSLRGGQPQAHRRHDRG